VGGANPDGVPPLHLQHDTSSVGKLRRRSVLANSDKRFVLFWDLRSGKTRYRWRLSAASSETVEWSAKGYADKSECEADIEYMKNTYPDAPVVDLTVTRD
jgi:uncharacterized protein YegP (UPF0339 family)